MLYLLVNVDATNHRCRDYKPQLDQVIGGVFNEKGLVNFAIMNGYMSKEELEQFTSAGRRAIQLVQQALIRYFDKPQYILFQQAIL